MSVDDINQYYDKMMSELTQNQKKVEIDNEVHKVLQFQEMMLKQLDFVDQDPEHHAETPEPEITRPKTVIKLRKKKGRPSIGKEFDPKEEFNRRRSVEAHMDLEDLFD